MKITASEVREGDAGIIMGTLVTITNSAVFARCQRVTVKTEAGLSSVLYFDLNATVDVERPEPDPDVELIEVMAEAICAAGGFTNRHWPSIYARAVAAALREYEARP